MPVPTSQRHSRPNSPPTSATTNSTTTPLRPVLSGVFNTTSSGTSYSPTVTQGAHSPKLNVVTRVAIEGKAKHGDDGASIKMYLKIALPLDIITPGSTIPLFPEESVKILTSQVHPLDNNSVPYDFSSDLSPLLHNAARALNLPSRSSESYHATFGLSPPATSASVAGSVRSSKSNGSSRSSTPPVDNKYTGHILVSGYNISYVLPKAFPGRFQDSDVYSRSSGSIRRASIVERNTVQFMAAIDMWVPYASRPPRSPYLLSIPTPRCLHNNVRLRIFPPTAASASFASLSSTDEEGGSWDLTSDPHVTRATSSRQSRSGTYSYGNIADDESSDSSTTGFSEGCGIQGTFPSAERIRVRWAKPTKVVGAGDDGRRRVGVKDVKGEMTCAVLGKMWDPEYQRDGIVMNVEYKGTCKGVWFPGVATMLGMDVSLEAKGSDISWIPGGTNEWAVGGGAGYTGFDVGAPPKPEPPSRHDSLESSSSNGPQIFLSAERGPSAISRQSPASSSSSLLRGPLPVHNVPEYSFEGSGPSSVSASQTTSIESSVVSLLPSSTPSLDPTPRPPGVPVTIHVNMNELTLPASKNSFPFRISGTVLVTPRPRPASVPAPSRNSSPVRGETDADTQSPPVDPDSIVIPRFTVLAADNETVAILVRNDVAASAPCTVEVNVNGESYQRGPSASKTVLQRGEFTKCMERARIAVKPGIAFASAANGMSVNGKLAPPSRPRTPSSVGTSRDRVPSTTARAMSVLGMVPSRPKRDGVLMIPSVVADVTPLVVMPDSPSSRLAPMPASYAVRVCLAAPVDSDSDWLEFGLAKHAEGGSVPADIGPPKVEIVSVSVDDVPVLYETSVAVKQQEAGVGLPFEQMSGQEWVSWVKLRVGAAGGGQIVVDYVVRDVGGPLSGTDKKGKMKAKDQTQFDVYLPSFGIPVGRLEVNIDGNPGLEIFSLRSNFSHHQSVGSSSGRRLLHYSLHSFFYPHISLNIRPARSSVHSFLPIPNSFGPLTILVVSWAVLILGSVYLVRLNLAVYELSNSLQGYSTSRWSHPEPVTITSTAFQATRWPWFPGHSDTESASEFTESVSAIPSSTVPAAITTAITPSVVETRRAVPTFTKAEPSTSVALLQPLRFNITWPEVDMDLMLEKLLRGAEKLWHFLQKIYHYPLDPT
ncbi:hypothetical protein DFH07DRAFT_828991 [Mycena maculata]|uniref:Uncharacterized protein n=1 Tax=Mycena maculata TaxID=230809 RepID=A0AAD7IUT8_9AGAR|nr:hypothetical protein DFH07DRAFT_828991 [Mycena maculata]